MKTSMLILLLTLIMTGTAHAQEQYSSDERTASAYITATQTTGAAVVEEKENIREMAIFMYIGLGLIVIGLIAFAVKMLR